MLYWGCRRRADLYLDEWARQAAAQMPNLAYVPVLSEPAPADAWTGRTGFEPPTVTVDVHMLTGGRYVNLVATFAAGPEGEQMARDLIASLSIG